MVRLTIDGREVEVEAGATVLDAAQKAGIEVPTLCHLPGPGHRPSCMVCVVEVRGRAGLVASCGARAEDGMVVRTDTERVRQSRQMSLELLLSDHAGDCVAPCARVCPAGFDAATMVALVARGELSQARRKVAEDLPLASVLGMICAGYCERVCHRRNLDAPVSIGDIHAGLAADMAPAARATETVAGERDAAAEAGSTALPEADVAIVGGGAAGLVAAWELSRLGFSCVVLEARSQFGGALRQVEAMGRLPSGMLDRELGTLLSGGVEVRLGWQLVSGAQRSQGSEPRLEQKLEQGQGGQVSLADLRQRYRSVILALGSLADDPALRGLLASEGLSLNARGVQVDRRTLSTGLPGVFAAGAMTGGGRNLALYVGQGRRAAAAAAAMLQMSEASAGADSGLIGAPAAGDLAERAAALSHLATAEESPSRLTRLTDDDVSNLASAADSGGRISPLREAWDGSTNAEGRADHRELLGEADLLREARRCLQCSCEKLLDCRLRHLVLMYGGRGGRYNGTRRGVARDGSHPLVVYDSGKCVQCGICVRIAQEHREVLGLTFIGRGFQVRTAGPFGASLDSALRQAARNCATACPTGALVLKRPGQ